MQAIRRLIQFLREDLWLIDITDVSRLRRSLLHSLRVIALVFKGFKEDQCPLHASALTFSAVMAMVPTLVIVFAFAKGFGMDKLDRYIREDILDVPSVIAAPALPDHPDPLSVTNAAAPFAGLVAQADAADGDIRETDDPAQEEGRAEAAGAVGSYFKNMAADMPKELKEVIAQILDTVKSASVGALGSISIVFFLWIMIKMLSRIEETFNLVWGVKTSRSMLDKVRNYVFVMAVAPVLLIVGISAGPTLIALSNKLEWVLGPLSQLLTLLIPVLIMALAFAIVYLFLPNTRVRVRPAVAGALISALSVIVLQAVMIKAGFGVAKYNAIYGGLAALPMFLFWLQLSWMVMLFGAEIAFAVQNVDTYKHEQEAANASAQTRLILAFAVMQHILDGFHVKGPRFNAETYAAERRIPVKLINNVIHVLCQAELITASAEDPRCYTLLKDPALINPKEVYDLILQEGAMPAELGLRKLPERVENLMSQIDGSLAQALANTTLKG